MNALLVIAALGLSLGIVLVTHPHGAGAVLVTAVMATLCALAVSRSEYHRLFLLRLFAAALLARMAVGTVIHLSDLQVFFGADAYTYDIIGDALVRSWSGDVGYGDTDELLGPFLERNWGMSYAVAAIYAVVGRNMLAVQFFNAVLGAATAPIIFLCAHHIFGNLRVAKIAALFVAFYPSLILWSSQGLKDGPIVFLLALIMLATFKLGENLSAKYFLLLAAALFSVLTLRFYIFYMATAAVVGSFVIGMRARSTQSLIRHFAVVVGIGLVLTYLGVLRTASRQIEDFADLERIQLSRADLAGRAQSGFGKDIDVSTTAGALTAIPVGVVYLLFAPFPWQLTNLRQSITLPEMVVWWGSFPLLVLGAWFTVKYRLRRALPILLFTTMLTFAYSIFQGNVGTAYRQRSQILVFYFIFVAVGAVLVKEKRENRRQQERLALRSAELNAARKRRTPWRPPAEGDGAAPGQKMSLFGEAKAAVEKERAGVGGPSPPGGAG